MSASVSFAQAFLSNLSRFFDAPITVLTDHLGGCRTMLEKVNYLSFLSIVGRFC